MLPNIVEEVGLGVVVRFSPPRRVCTEVDIRRSTGQRRHIHRWGLDKDNISAFNNPPILGVPQSSAFAVERVAHHDSFVRLSRKLLGVYFNVNESTGTDHTKVRQIRLEPVEAFEW